MIGPVLYLEMLLGSRRGRAYVFRWVYAGWLILQFSFMYLIYRAQYNRIGMARPDTNATGWFASGFVEVFVVQQLILMLLATPAFAAGAITDEKTRGTLQYLLTADLTAWEIVLGKLVGRMAQVAILALVGLPLLCFVGVFGGLHPLLLLAVLATTVAPLFALGSASILASVWCKQTRDAVLGLYALGFGGYLLVWGTHELADYLAGNLPVGAGPGWFTETVETLDGLLSYFNPLFVMEPAWGSDDARGLAWRLLGSLLAWGSVGIVCLGLSVWRLRAAYLKQLEGEGKKSTPHWWQAERSAVSEEPIRWRERNVEGVAPLVIFKRVPRWLGLTLIFSLTVAVCGAILWAHRPAGLTLSSLLGMIFSFDVAGLQAAVFRSLDSSEQFFWLGVVVTLIASLVVGIRCSGAVSGEREKQTWEALLLTPLATRQLIRGKLWGVLGASAPYLLAYAIPALTLAPLGGAMAMVWVILWVGVTLLAMWFVGAAGLWCSVRSRSSWRSLLGTLGFGYVGGFLVFAVSSPAMLILALILVLALVIIDSMLNIGLMQAANAFGTYFYLTFQIAVCVVLTVAFYGASWAFIYYAEKRVSDRERVRHWKNEPAYRPRALPEQPRFYR